MIKKSCIILLCLLLALTGCSRGQVETEGNVPEEETNTEVGKNSEEGKDIDIERNYKLIAYDSDVAGINTDTYFTLYSEAEVSKDFIEKNIKITPKQDLKIEKVSNKEFKVMPLANLKSNAVYKIEVEAPNTTKSYTWAFQTKKELSINRTLPANKSNYVPIDTGIEMYFTYDNVEDIEEYFEIEPKIDGKFLYERKSVIFVPSNLDYNTTYTVKVKPGVSIKDSDLKLGDEYSFSFTTVEKRDLYYFNPYNLIYNFTEKQVPMISVGLNDEMKNESFDVNIYRYESADKMLKDLKEYDDNHNFQTMYKDEIPSYLNLEYTLNLKPLEVKQNYSTIYLFELPKELETGHYLVEYNYKDNKYYHYLQRNNLLVYNVGFENEQLTWVSDSSSNELINGAKVKVEDSEIVKTNEEGIAVTSYKEEKTDEDYYSYYNKGIFFTVEADEFEKFVGRSGKNNIYRDVYYGFPNHVNSNDYWRYMYSDRSTYLPDDTINIWGYINPKSGKKIESLKLSLVSNQWGKHEIENKTINLSNIGTFNESFTFEDMTPGWYDILLSYGEENIINKQIYISEYTKPIYKLSGEFDKDFISNGETIIYTSECNFFDGTPVSGIELEYNYFGDINNKNGTVSSDKNGKANIEIQTYSKSNDWRPKPVHFSIYNKNAEDQQITNTDSFMLFPKDKMLEIDMSEENTPNAKILFHQLDTSNYNKENKYSYEALRSNPLDKKINIEVSERYYERVLENEYYDHINKVNRKRYKSIEHINIIKNFEAYTVDGSYLLDCSDMQNLNSYYTIEVTYSENGDKIVETRSYGNYIRENYDRPEYYTLKLEDISNNDFKLGENIDYYLARNESKVESTKDDKLLILTMQNGLMKHEILEDTNGNFNFNEKHIPNILLKGVYITNGKLKTTLYDMNVNYDYSEREIDFKVKTDKEFYKPGEEVILNIEAKDKNDNPCLTDINISVVDEAYFSLFNSEAYTLSNIYRPTYGDGINYEFTSYKEAGMNDRSMAEKGGGGDDNSVRSDFEDTAIFKTITTDKNGKATVKFELPDNLTSWRITYQGVSDDMYAGSGKMNISTKLPFFINAILGKTYITGDEPCITLRSFGEEVNKDDEVSYEVVIEKEDVEKNTISSTGKAGNYTNVKLGKLDKGKYKVTVYASNNSYKDAIELSFEVVDSTVYFNLNKYYSISKDTKFREIYSNAVVTFFNEAESDFYECLNELNNSYGNRIDQKLANELAREFLINNFDYKHYGNYNLENLSYKKYQRYDGGIGLLSYDSSDTVLSAKLCSLTDEKFNNEGLKAYFYSILENNNSDLNSVTAAYWGLSTFNEPILLNVYEMLENTDLELKEKLYLVLALSEFGDMKEAKKIFEEVTGSYSETVDDYEKINYYENETDNLELTALTAVLAVKLNEYEKGDKYFNYMVGNPSKYILANIEKLIYILNRDIMYSDDIKNLEGEVTIDIGGKKQTLKLYAYKTESINVTPKELLDMEITDVKSDIGCHVRALGGEKDLEESKTDDFSITKSYYLDEVSTSIFSQSDLIKVVINPTFSKGIEHHYYQITDFIPAGFRYVRYISSNMARPIEQSGQKLIFNYYYDHDNKIEPLTYYIQAVQPGTYTADHTVISNYSFTELFFTEKEKLIIE